MRFSQQVELRNINNDPKMSRKRKIDADGRLFQERWEGEYMFVLQGEKTVCLLCYEVLFVVKDPSLHFDMYVHVFTSIQIHIYNICNLNK